MLVTTYFKKLRNRELTIVLGKCPPLLLEYFSERGYSVCDYKDFDFSSGKDVFVISNSAKISDHMISEIWDNHNCNFAHINPWKLHNNFAESLIYTVDCIISSDIDSSLIERQRLLEIFENDVQDSLNIQSLNSNLQIEFKGDVEITNTDISMKRGWSYSIAEFFEVGLLNFGGRKETGFQVSGNFDFDGIVAFKSQSSTASKDEDVKELISTLSNHENKMLTVEQNTIKKVCVDDIDISELVFRCLGVVDDSDELYEEAKLKEVAFGCNRIDTKRLDWQKNSLINEGVYGFHLGFGLADRASHIDFVRAGNYNMSW